VFFLAWSKAERQGLKPRKTRLSARLEGSAACSGFNTVTGDRITQISADFSPGGLDEVLAQLGMELA
jgi:hypothetical protein